MTSYPSHSHTVGAGVNLIKGRENQNIEIDKKIVINYDYKSNWLFLDESFSNKGERRAQRVLVGRNTNHWSLDRSSVDANTS